MMILPHKTGGKVKLFFKGLKTKKMLLIAGEMKKQKYGRIINVASVAAFSSQMPGSLYGGIKLS